MNKRKKPAAGGNLRQRAEEQLLKNEFGAELPVPAADAAHLLHELQVHQIELQMQNEELRRTEEQLQITLEKYADLYNLAPVGYFALAKDGTIMFVNLLGARLLGRECSQLVGHPFDAFVAEEARPIFSEFLQNTFGGLDSVTCEVALFNEGGCIRDVRIAATGSTTGDDCRMIVVDITKSKAEEVALKSAYDHLEQMVVTRTADLAEANVRMQQDIADRKLAEQALRESEERYKRLLSSITNYVYRVHVENGIAMLTEHGEGCQAATGYAPEEYAENPLLWITMIHDADQSAVQEVMKRIMTAQAPLTVEHRIHAKDGQLRWIRNTLVPHRDSEGRLIFYDGIIADITERKQGEEDNFRLEQLAMQGEKLRALGHLAAGVAHEVRNPLNAINITLALIAGHLKDIPECQEYLARTRRQISRIDNLMKDMLELRRPEEAQNLRRCTIAYLCDLAANAWEQSQKELRHKLILIFEPAAEQAEILVDPERMVQVLVNLLDNAAQHSADGTEIRVLAVGMLDGYADIMVRDQGPGLPDAGIEHAFDPFFTTRKGGSGLGLSIVKHIIETYCGQVSISNNTPVTGCTVKIRLPVMKDMRK